MGGEGIRVARHKGFDCAWQIDVPHVPAHLMREAIRLMREAISLDEGGRLTSHTPPRTKNSLYPLLRCAPARRSLVSLR